MTAMRAVGHSEVEVGRQLLGAHHRVRAAVGLADRDGHLRHVGLDDGVEEPAAALDDAVLLLLDAGQEARGVDDEHQRHVERVAEPHEAGGLVGGLVVDRARHVHRLVGDHPDRTAVDAGVTGDDRLAGLRGDVEEVAVVEDPQQDLVHVVGDVVGVGNEAVEFQVVRGDLGLQPGLMIGASSKVLAGQEVQVVADVLEGVLLGVHDLVDVAVLGLCVGAAELVEGDVLTGDVLDDVGAGDEHVALVAHGHHEVGLDRRVHRAAGALAQDDRDLRHQAGQQLVPAAQLGVPGQRGGHVLDAGAAGVVDADDRAADHGDPLHQPGNLAAEHLSHRAAEHGVVVAEHTDRTAVDGAVPGDHTVAEQRVRIAGRAGQRADLQETARVEQRVNSRARTGDAASCRAWPRPPHRPVPWPAPAFRGVRPASRQWYWRSLGLVLLGVDTVDRLAHVGANLGDVRLVDRLDVFAPDRHDLQVGDELTPPAVGLRTA